MVRNATYFYARPFQNNADQLMFGTGEVKMNQQVIKESAVGSNVLASAVLAILLGAFIVLGTGFAHSDTIHNAAHDSRHSFAFPCH